MNLIKYAVYFAINLILFTGSSFADLTHFTDTYSKTTGSSCLYAGKVFINGEQAIDGEDEVGVFVDDENGGEMLIGADHVREIQQGYSGYYTFEIYGDNPTTNEKDGARADNALIFKVWDKSTDTEYTLSDSDFQTESSQGLELPQIPLIWENSHKDKYFGLLNLNVSDNDNPTVSWSLNTQSVNEDAGTVTLTATLDEINTSNDVTINYSISGTSSSPDDHNAVDATMTITSGDTTAITTFTIINDTEIEENETLIITMDSVTYARKGVTDIQTITINDDDIPTVNWSLETQTVSEAAGSVTITATLDEINPRNDITVSYTVSGSSDSPDDHNALNGTLTITSGDTRAITTFTINNDTEVEENETLIISMSTVNNAVKGIKNVQTITINDDDTTTSDLSHFTQAYSKTTGSSCLYAGKVFINGEQAIDGEDEVGVFVDDENGGEMLIGADHVREIQQGYSGYYTFEIYGDNPNTDEKDGARADNALIFKVWDKSTDTEFTLSDSDFQTESSQGLELPQIPLIWENSHKDKYFGLLNLNVSDNDKPTVSWSLNTQSVNEDAGTVTLTATLDEINTSNDVTINYSISGTSSSPDDHNAVDGTITITSGNITAITNFTIINDTEIEENETLIITMNTVTNAEKGEPNVQTIKINDNDIPTVNWTLETQTVSENADTVTITAALDEINPRDDVIVSFAISGTSTSPDDHNASDSTITITSGDTTAISTFTINNDTEIEENETLIITMDTVTNAVKGEPDTQTITILDNDVPTITITGHDSVHENNKTSILTVQLDQPNPREKIDLQYQINGTAAIDSDYTIEPASPLSILSGQTEFKLTITTIEDGEVEPDETVIVSLVNATHADLVDPLEHTITIIDNDVPTVNWTLETQTVSENADTVTITAALDEINPRDDVIVSFAISGTSTSPDDHNASDATITITSGDTTAVTTFTINNDTEIEENETLIITMDTVTNAVKGEPDTQTITILDNDVPTITITGHDSVYENNKTSILTVQLDQPNPRENIDLQYQINGTAAIDSDYTIEPTSPLSILSGQTEFKLTITTIEDGEVEPDETVIVSLVNATHADLVDPVEHTITIIDNDVPTVNWTIETQTVSEDADTVTITAALDEINPRDDVIVSFAISGTSNSPDDHNASDATITITSGDTTAVTTFTINNDTEIEENETLIITMDTVTNAVKGEPDTQTITILDNDVSFIINNFF